GGGVRITGGWAGTWDAAQVDNLSYLEHGPILDLVWATGAWSLGTRGAIAWRTYLAPDPAYSSPPTAPGAPNIISPETTRNDTRYFATTWIERALGARWSVRGTVKLIRTSSNIPDLNSTEWIFIGSLTWTGAVL